jgi:hypothetical protein
MFELENQMAPVVVRWLTNQGMTVKREFEVPWGICDFVGVLFNTHQVKARLEYGQTKPIGSAVRVSILAKIPDITSGLSISLEELYEQEFGYLSHEALSSEVQRLVKMKFVRAAGDGQYQKLNGWYPLQKRIVAIELKLSRISEALAQGSANRSFTSESYVGLPSALAYRVAQSRRVSEFRAKGVGIVAVSAHSCRRVLNSSSEPKIEDTVLQSHCVERFWKIRAKSS